MLQKCLRFNPDATVWKAKQQVLCSLTESLRDVLNYGLFQPATDGHDAKFLEEERLLREYPQSFEKGVPYLEVWRGLAVSRPGSRTLGMQGGWPACFSGLYLYLVEGGGGGGGGYV